MKFPELKNFHLFEFTAIVAPKGQEKRICLKYVINRSMPIAHYLFIGTKSKISIREFGFPFFAHCYLDDDVSDLGFFGFDSLRKLELEVVKRFQRCVITNRFSLWDTTLKGVQ